MALIKQTELENGLSGSYWKIIGIKCDTSMSSAFIEYGLIKDADFRANLGNDIPTEKYILTERYAFEGGEFWEAFALAKTVPIFSLSYTILKNKVENFKDAIDG